jgi:GT2 family glycosyltransferase
MSLFAVSRGCIEKIGWFDEVFWPAYFEDWDFHRRLVLAGDDQTGVATGVRHHKSASTGGRHPLWRHNLATFSAKWGYDPQTGLCLFTTPYGGLGRGGTDL